MIIGNGDIANALTEIDCDDHVYFASGVSNSSETRASEFQRERDLLFNLKDEKHIIYFSSLAIFYLQTPYTQHKRQMEQCIRTWAHSYSQHFTVVRLGNIDWGTNPHTLINYLCARAQAGEQLEIQDTFRYIVSKDEFLHWMRMIPSWSVEMNIPGERLTVAQIVERYVLPSVELAA